MSEALKTVAIISASPKTDQKLALSEYLAEWAQAGLSGDTLRVERIQVRRCLQQKSEAEAYETMASADALVLIFPLYFFCLPGMLMRFLQDYAAFLAAREPPRRSPDVFAVINCGFPEPQINEEALRVVQSFSKAIGAAFCFGVLIGGGGMILGAKGAPFMKPTLTKLEAAFARMRQWVLRQGSPSTDTDVVTVKFPRRLYFMMGNLGWRLQSRRYGVKRRELRRRPYALGTQAASTPKTETPNQL